MNSDDLSTLAWVHDELRRSLEAAHKALRRFVKETESLGGSDMDAIDPVVLRNARSQIHQGVGALELVGQPAAAMVLRASEAAVQRFVTKPHKLTAAVVDDLERASFALLDYLSRLLAGKPVSTLSLFPQYRAVQEAAGADRVHPADLWVCDWQWRELPADPKATPHEHDAAMHTALESQLLPLMRATDPLPVAARMSELTAALGAGASQTHVATLWKLAAAVFEAQAHGLLGFDVFSKRVASRLLAQFRILERGEPEVSERLAQDLLFFCAQSVPPVVSGVVPRLTAVRNVYGLAASAPVDYTVSVLGRFDPAVIAQARKRVTAGKDAWSAVAGGELHRMTGLSEQFALVGESLKKLFPHGETFAGELQLAIAQTQNSGAAPSAPLAMEVATSLLYVEAALDDADFDHPDQFGRVRRLAERLAAVRAGRTPEPLEAWMEELYRRVSDRQTMGSVVQELRASLSESEKLIDQYFRKPEDREVLIPVPNQLSAMRGVLSVLGMDQACAVLLRMRDEVDGLASTEVDAQRVAQAGVFDRLAGNLGALGFLIDMLSVQPQMAKSLFAFDADSGTLNPVMGRSGPVHAPAIAPAPATAAPVEQRLIDQAQMLAVSSVREDVPVADVSRDLERLAHEAQAADQPALAATAHKAQEALHQASGPEGVALARGELSEALADFVSTASDPVGLEPLFERAAPGAGSAGRISSPMRLDFAPSTASAQLAQDDEMREIFLEEAREVLATAATARSELETAPDDLGSMTTLRRAFHTLKGSSRMVGLKDFGEAAWACEQLYNTHLADQHGAPTSLLEFTAWCLDYLSGWVADISAKRSGAHGSATVVAAAQRVGEPAPAAAPVSTPVPLGLPADLPNAVDLDLHAAPVAPPADVPVPVFEPTAPEPLADVATVPDDAALPSLSFELDLSALDATVASEHEEIISEHAPLDMNSPALHDPFDVQPIEALPVPEVSETTSADMIDLDLALDFGDVAPATSAEPLPVHAEADMSAAVAEQQGSSEEHVKVVGPLRIGIPLFNIYLHEADELSRRLTTEVAEWAMELHRPIGEAPIALAHSLAGSSATVGFSDLSQLARSLEHAQARSLAIGHGTPEEARLFVDAAEEIRHLLHQFAAGFLKEPSPELIARLAEHELSSARRLEAAAAAEELQPTSGPDALADAAAVPDDHHRDESVHEPASEPAPLVTAEPEVAWRPVADSTYALTETRFDQLGLAELKPLGEAPVESNRSAALPSHGLVDADEAIDAVDAVDGDLFPIFDEEAGELLPQLASRLRDWARKPAEATHPAACMRTLHTLKGGARLAGAMRLGEMAHRLETRIERLLAQPPVSAADVEALQAHGDALAQTLDLLRSGGVRDESAQPVPAAAPEVAAPVAAPTMPELEVLLESAPPEAVESAAAPLATLSDGLSRPAMLDGLPSRPATLDAPPEVAEPVAAELTEPSAPLAEIDWSRFELGDAASARKPGDRTQAAQSAVRVRAPLLDRLVNQAGEVSITRSRIETGVSQIKTSLVDLTENLERLRAQLRDIEFHGETQMSSRLEAAKAASQSFDPLEFDRFTRFQELTRMMAESVNDVATVQRTLQRSLEVTEDELVAQARMTRDLQDDLLRTRMVEFEGLSERLYRVVRQVAKETGKSVRLDIVGGSIEVDRGVLDRMTSSFEHLLRNCVGHGIETPEVRTRAGKDATGSIIVAVSQEANEVGIEFRDDGAGLNLPRIRAKGEALGLIAPGAQPGDADLANLIFAPGFSTADEVTELSGRGVGMDVVRSEVNAMGGRIETATAAGQGTSFKLILPLTTAVTQVVMLRCGETQVAVPSTLVEVVRRASPAEIDAAYSTATYTVADRALQFFWLGALLQISARPAASTARTRAVVVIRSAQQRVALHVDEVLGNQEVVVKHLGPQLSRLPGLAGITLLASGMVALIYNPVALATLYGDAARAATHAALPLPGAGAAMPAASAPEAPEAPLVMVVDDSLTVRRVTQRLLVREGYRVVLAKDGLDALERLAEAVPAIVLSDIEMPRMDGFDLVRNMRGDARLRDLPVIMITSRIAQKHRDYAAELGVDHYLGKPYSEEDLLALVARYTAHRVATY
jgi:chemosensory pili system protein ChpA (sensor histidine kinase/response regulator)